MLWSNTVPISIWQTESFEGHVWASAVFQSDTVPISIWQKDGSEEHLFENVTNFASFRTEKKKKKKKK